ncbi:hypothetical protein [Chrysiogenes arsenatis]|uniref:hypothetical protein n=1 Tax=Chrysiogenes arsenatis TaxID=309797 RepID=UPI0003FFD04F|nr:hypothetical protein [Chrysiogenes arsenatis]
MSLTCTRTLFYRRAVWSRSQSNDLERIITDAHQKLSNTENRTFPHRLGKIQGLKYFLAENGGIFLHIGLYRPNQPTSIIPQPSPQSPATDLSVCPPPDGHDYLSGDIFVLIKNNHVILCPSGVHESIATSYLSSVLLSVDQHELAESYTVDPIVNTDNLRILNREGVKEIELSGALYSASVEHIERTTVQRKLFGSLAQEIRGMFASDVTPNGIENLNVRVTISFDSRKKESKLTAASRVADIAKKIVADEPEDDGFKIVTGKGNHLSARQMRVSEKVQLRLEGNTVVYNDVMNAVLAYMTTLQRDGTLSQ